MVSRPLPEDHDAQQGAGAPELVVEFLPLETRCVTPLRQYRGFWLLENTVRVAVEAVHARFTPRPSDVILASFPKSGTTWIKALAFATRNRAAHPPSSDLHPLHCSNPHDCVRFLEIDFELAKSVDEVSDELEALPSPRVLATHLPYSRLPERVREMCRIVSICRDPKDTLVSLWLFMKKVAPVFGRDASAFTFQEAFDLFCDGRCIYGPQWRHMLEYWEEAVKNPDKVLFLRYEEMLLDSHSNINRLAQFMEYEFSEEEEERGVVDAIAELCSLGSLKNMEVNKNGCGNLPIENASFFRKGVAGDWSSHMTPEMAERMDKVVEDALQGSGFAFNHSD